MSWIVLSSFGIPEQKLAFCEEAGLFPKRTCNFRSEQEGVGWWSLAMKLPTEQDRLRLGLLLR